MLPLKRRDVEQDSYVKSVGKALIYSILLLYRTENYNYIISDTNKNIRNVLYTSFQSSEYIESINGQIMWWDKQLQLNLRHL